MISWTARYPRYTRCIARPSEPNFENCRFGLVWLDGTINNDQQLSC